jgi:hypothetical protein
MSHPENGKLQLARLERAGLAVHHLPELTDVDAPADAVALTRRAGGFTLLREVFDDVPGTGRWATALLADGNSEALLHRVRQLLLRHGPG